MEAMGKPGLKETPEWDLGEWGRNKVATLLKELGWRITPLDRIEDGGAPAMEGDRGFYAALPDFDVAKSGARRYVEVKTKKDCAFFRKWERTVHGISLRSLRSYQAVQVESGTTCWLFVVEKNRGNILSAPLDLLILPRWSQRVDQAQDPGGNIYFDRDAFALFGVVAGELFDLRDKRWLPARCLR